MRLSASVFALLAALANAASLATVRRGTGVGPKGLSLATRSGLRRSLALRAAEGREIPPERLGRHMISTAPRAGEITPMEKLAKKAMLTATALASGPLMAGYALAAEAAADEGSRSIPQAAYPSLGLFLLSFPGVWSQIKRAPKASVKRATFEVAGPGAQNPVELDQIASQLFRYMLKYNYEVKDRGEVITFAGKYASDKGQAAFITAFTFLSMLSLGLVLSTIYPEIGNKWYLLSLISPAAGAFVLKNGEREEEFRIKMATSEDQMFTDIFVEGDIEEIERMQKELGLNQKGKVKVKGLFEENPEVSSS